MSEPGNIQVVLMGMTTVFLCLVLLIFIVMLMGKLIQSFAIKPVTEIKAEALMVKPPIVKPDIVDRYINENEDNKQIIAAIITVLAAETGMDGSAICIQSIKPL